jgi:hypothetical protein
MSRLATVRTGHHRSRIQPSLERRWITCTKTRIQWEGRLWTKNMKVSIIAPYQPNITFPPHCGVHRHRKANELSVAPTVLLPGGLVTFKSVPCHSLSWPEISRSHSATLHLLVNAAVFTAVSRSLVRPVAPWDDNINCGATAPLGNSTLWLSRGLEITRFNSPQEICCLPNAV